MCSRLFSLTVNYRAIGYATIAREFTYSNSSLSELFCSLFFILGMLFVFCLRIYGDPY